jgi:hypothetical protein
LSFLLWGYYTKEPPPGSVLGFENHLEKGKVQKVNSLRV